MLRLLFGYLVMQCTIIQNLQQGYIYKYQTTNMQTMAQSIQLGLLSQMQICSIRLMPVLCQCSFYVIQHSQSAGPQKQQVTVQLRGDYVIQIEPIDKAIICGFKCDYEINFEIVRNPSSVKQTLGTPKQINFIFKSLQNRQVTLFSENVKDLQLFARKLQKKYIVQLGFHESFKAVKILGKGLTATVYKAISYRDRKDVAIKSFKRTVYFATPNGKLSFQKEFQTLASLQHKNICGLESVYETDNTTYIVMQNLALSLFGWIQKYGFPSFEEGKKIMSQLLKGIEYLHSLSIMHRDLKLENIMVRKDSKQNAEIVIVDLGLAQSTNQKHFLYTRCGTPGYVAPQILKHKSQSQNYNELCDVFSLGVIFHILTFKKTIFQGPQVRQVIKKNTECNINFDDELYSTFPREGLNLMKRMLQKQPSKRISASEALNHQYFKCVNHECSNLQTNYSIELIKDIVA